MKIRYAQLSDLEQLAEIKNYYISNSHALFETEPISPENLKTWFKRYSTSGAHRIWVADEQNEVLGYAYSSKYRDGEYFSKTIETSVYVKPNLNTKGVGSALYERLFQDLKNEKLHTVLAGIGLPNPASIALHKKFGFNEVGVFKEYAMKNGEYISSLWMQKEM